MMPIVINWPSSTLAPKTRSNTQRVTYEQNMLAKQCIEALNGQKPRFGGSNLVLMIQLYPPSKFDYKLTDILYRLDAGIEAIYKEIGINKSQVTVCEIEVRETVEGGQVVLRLEDL